MWSDDAIRSVIADKQRAEARLTAERAAHARTRDVLDRMAATMRRIWPACDGVSPMIGILRDYRALPPLAPGDVKPGAWNRGPGEEECDMYEHGTPRSPGPDGCGGDGHHLCQTCSYYTPDELAPGAAAPAIQAAPTCEPPPPGAPAPRYDALSDSYVVYGVRLSRATRGPIRYASLDNRAVASIVHGRWTAVLRAADGVRVVAIVDGYSSVGLAIDAIAEATTEEDWRALPAPGESVDNQSHASTACDPPPPGAPVPVDDANTITVRGVTVRDSGGGYWHGRMADGTRVYVQPLSSPPSSYPRNTVYRAHTVRSPLRDSVSEIGDHPTPRAALEALAAKVGEAWQAVAQPASSESSDTIIARGTTLREQHDGSWAGRTPLGGDVFAWRDGDKWNAVLYDGPWETAPIVNVVRRQPSPSDAVGALVAATPVEAWWR